MTGLSPAWLISLTWAGAFVICAIGLMSLHQTEMIALFLEREHIQLEAFTPITGLWLATALCAFWLGTVLPRTPDTQPRVYQLNRVFARFAIVNLGCLVTTATWLLVTAGGPGGLMAWVQQALQDTLAARDGLLANKLFVGMRLLYATLAPLTCVGVVLLATGHLTRSARHLCWALLFGNLFVLLVLPLVMSQRLLLVAGAAGAYLSLSLYTRRARGLGWVLLGALAFALLWTGREWLTVRGLEANILAISAQKLAFYVINDMWNAVAVVAEPAPRTLGAVSLNGAAIILGLSEAWSSAMPDSLAATEALRGGGTFPLLTAPFVDFGPVGAVLTLIALGYICQSAYMRAPGDLRGAVIYGQIGAALLLSAHSPYLLHQNVLVGIALTAWICAPQPPSTVNALRRPPARKPLFHAPQ